MEPTPVDNPHTCVICKKKIRKNKESYRGHLPAEMVAVLRKVKPDFHVKMDICLECGDKYYKEVEPRLKKSPWMTRRLG
jgi:hypothetical protein